MLVSCQSFFYWKVLNQWHAKSFENEMSRVVRTVHQGTNNAMNTSTQISVQASVDSLLPPPQISGDEFYSDVAKGILQYVSRNLSHRVCIH